jgi:Clp amino terminal domain, pathogenicity island component
MFERYTERARRVIFYARYEASQYGSQYIETEHMLLGLLRDGRLSRWFPGESGVEPKIRTEIEKRIQRRERISTSIEMPLSSDSRKVLTLADEAREKLRHDYVEPEHILIAIFQVEGSLAAQVLNAHGAKGGSIQEQLKKSQLQDHRINPPGEPSVTLGHFLAGLKSLKSDELFGFFCADAEFIDASGNRCGMEEISKDFESLFAWYAKKNASYALESTLLEADEVFVAIVLWKNMLLASEERAWMHRMSVVLVTDGGDWKVQLVQVTPVRPSTQTPNPR